MPDKKQVILQRLRTAEGHLRAIRQMLVEDQPCQQVLHQLNAVQCALQSAGSLLLQMEVERCLRAVLYETCSEQQVQELERLSSLYLYIYKLNGRTKESFSR